MKKTENCSCYCGILCYNEYKRLCAFCRKRVNGMRKFKGKENSRGDITARADDAFGSQNYAEYMVDMKKKGKYKTQRSLMVMLYVLVSLVIVVLMVALTFPWIGLLIPIAVWILWFFTWPYVSRSFYYTVDGSFFTILKVFGGRLEDDFVKVKISEAEMIAPMNEEYSAYAHAHADAIQYEAVSSFDASDIYFMTFTNAEGKPCVIFFEATQQLLKALKYYNSKAVVMTKTLR